MEPLSTWITPGVGSSTRSSRGRTGRPSRPAASARRCACCETMTTASDWRRESRRSRARMRTRPPKPGAGAKAGRMAPPSSVANRESSTYAQGIETRLQVGPVCLRRSAGRSAARPRASRSMRMVAVSATYSSRARERSAGSSRSTSASGGRWSSSEYGERMPGRKAGPGRVWPLAIAASSSRSVSSVSSSQAPKSSVSRSSPASAAFGLKSVATPRSSGRDAFA